MKITENGNGIVERNGWARAMVMAEAVTIRSHVVGVENLGMAREIVCQEKPLFMLLDHRSNADAPAIEKALIKRGFGDLAEKLVFLRGTRLDKSRDTRFLSQGFSHIDVWPQTEKPITKEEEKQAVSMMRVATRALDEAVKEGRVIVIFPEGTRTRTGKLGEGIPEIAHYLLRYPNAYVLPVGLIGTDRVLPVDKKIPRFAKVRVVFGEPFSVEEFCEARDIQKKERQRLIDGIMRDEIAPLLPVSYRGAYA
jgi:1-acyl-sn-glycerol-3-phosphate acyltransferase